MKQFLLRFFTWWNGATLNTLFYTRREGELVGHDQFGNAYYRSKGGKIDPALGFDRRWVIYNGTSEASMTPSGWNGWLHHTVFNGHRMAGETQAGYFLCNDCREKFTCRTGTVMERSHIPLHKWLFAIHLMSSSKKGMSALQLMRNLGLGSYRTAWFLTHRVREAMADLEPNKSPLGGTDKVVEADETVVGGKAKNRAYRDPAPKKMVATLVERGGRVRSKQPTSARGRAIMGENDGGPVW